MYPMLNDNVELGFYEIEGSDEVSYYAINPDGEEYEIGEDIVKALEHADGTKPLDISKKTIEKLKRCGLIRTSRFVKDEGLLNRLILFPVGSNAKKYQFFCRILNSILLVSSVIIFMTGMRMRVTTDLISGYDFDCVLYYGSIVMSMFAHEMGHFVAGLAYGYKITDTGIVLLGIIPVGAYVAHEDRCDHISRGKKILFALAGVSVNMMLAGIFLILSLYYFPLSFTFTMIANLNVSIGLYNLLPVAGLDGERALSELFGVTSINAFMRKCLRKKKYRKKLLKRGVKGYVCMGVFGFIILSEIMIRLLIVFEIGCLIFSALKII